MLVAIIVFGVAAPYWGWVHDTGLGLGVPWIPKTPIYKVTPPQFPGKLKVTFNDGLNSPSGLIDKASHGII